MKPFRHIVLFALLAIMAVGCGKEEAIKPSTSGVGTELMAKGRLGAGQGVDGDDKPQEGINGCDADGPDQGSPGISDDGDDISDSEKTRKKRR
ncbi:MAG: hypothetical protein H6592_11975 [Flavobacteriales bacterium]|nr:hypothetical protein [Flavobacteriales bacterium]HPF90352.1 hypothetical protein [Flavobacteriales bacterium]